MTAEDRAWTFLKSIDASYDVDAFDRLTPEQAEHVRVLAGAITETTVGALRWAVDRSGAIVWAEARRIEAGGEW